MQFFLPECYTKQRTRWFVYKILMSCFDKRLVSRDFSKHSYSCAYNVCKSKGLETLRPLTVECIIITKLVYGTEVTLQRKLENLWWSVRNIHLEFRFDRATNSVMFLGPPQKNLRHILGYYKLFYWDSKINEVQKLLTIIGTAFKSFVGNNNFLSHQVLEHW